MSSFFDIPVFSQYQAQSFYSPMAPYAGYSASPFAGLFAPAQTRSSGNLFGSPTASAYNPSNSFGTRSTLQNGLNILPIILREAAAASQPNQPQSSGSNLMSMFLMQMLMGRGNGGSITQSVIGGPSVSQWTQIEDNEVALLSRGAAGQSWRDAIQGGKLDDHNIEGIKSFFGSRLNNLADTSNGGFAIELLDRNGTERKAIGFDQFKSGAQYYDTPSNSWKALKDLDIAKNATTADVFWAQMKEKNAFMNLRYVDADTNKVLNIGTRWNNSVESQDVALLTRQVANQNWKKELDTRGGGYTEATNRIKNFLGSNYANLNDNSNGSMTVEFFDQAAKEIKTLSSADFIKDAQYYDEASKTWKPLNEKAKSALDLTKLVVPNGKAQLQIRYVDPTTREVKVINDRVYGHGSPVILDTNGNGKIDLTSLKDGVQFDLDGDGKKEQVSWTQAKGDKTDAWLALDRNGNGQIDSGKELFGNQHGLANGYEELKKFDDNKDGVIDAKDAVYSKLKTWKDINHDGVSQAGEMQDLKSAGVESIKLTYAESKDKDAFGNELRQQSAFTRTDDAAAKLSAELGKSAQSLKSGLAVDAWVNFSKAS